MNQIALFAYVVEGECLAGRRSLATAHAVRECAENWKVTLTLCLSLVRTQFSRYYCIPLTALIIGRNSIGIENIQLCGTDKDNGLFPIVHWK